MRRFICLVLILFPLAVFGQIETPGTGGTVSASDVSTLLTTLTNIVNSLLSTNAGQPASSTNALGFPSTNLLWGNTLFVDAVNGRNATALRGDASKPFLTISQANAVAVSGDTIFLRPGTYNLGTNHVQVKHGVSLIGQDKLNCIIRGSGTQDVSGCVITPPSYPGIIANLTINSRGDTNYTRVSLGSLDQAVVRGQAFTNAEVLNVRLESDTGTYTLNHTGLACSITLRNVDHIGDWDGIQQVGLDGNILRLVNNYAYFNPLGSSNALNDAVGILGYANCVRITQGYCYIEGGSWTSTNADQQGFCLVTEDAGVTSRVDVAFASLTAAGTNNIARIKIRNPTNGFVRLVGTPGNITTATLTSGRYQSTTADETVLIPNGAARTNDLPDTRWVWEGWSTTISDGGGTAAGTNIFIRPYVGSGQKIFPLGVTLTNIGQNYVSARLQVRGTNWWIVGSYP